MVRDRRVQGSERSVVEEPRGDLEVEQGRGAEHVTQSGISFRLLEPESSFSQGPPKIVSPRPTPNCGATCGPPIRCGAKSLNISLDGPATAWHVTQFAFPNPIRGNVKER